jgi:hypothetical protein
MRRHIDLIAIGLLIGGALFLQCAKDTAMRATRNIRVFRVQMPQPPVAPLRPLAFE